MKTRIPLRGIIVLTLAIPAMANVSAQSADEEFKAPRIWDENKLAGWTLPRGHQGLHQNYVTPEAYYGSPAYNTRTYPVYDPRQEPDGYWEWLHTLEPEPLVEPGVARSRDEWIRLGRDAFDQIDGVGFRMDDPEIIGFVRNPARISEENTTIAADGTIPRFRWVVESRGRVRLGIADCSACHVRVLPDGSKLRGAPGNQLLGGPMRAAVGRVARENFLGPEFASMTPGEFPYALFGVPWLTNDHHAALKDMTPDELRPVQSAEIPGTFPRVHGSPFWTTRIRDLRGVKHRPFLDATATHLNREPADIARYAAAVMYAGIPASFGTHDTFPEGAPRPLYHIEDDVLFALAMFLYSLEPAENPMKHRLNPALVARGREVFEQQDCARCHKPPDYSGDWLMPVGGYEVPEDHPLKDRIRRAPIDTDPGLALKTRKGTGLYKIPSLRGLWYRGLFGHDGSVSSLEDWFDPKRLDQDYVPTGWKGPAVEKRAVPGHEYGLNLSDEDKRSLIAFLETL